MKTFKLSQLFNIVDGRLLTKIEDVNEIFCFLFNYNYLTDSALLIYHQILKERNPLWFQTIKTDLLRMGASPDVDFETCVEIVNKNDVCYTIEKF